MKFAKVMFTAICIIAVFSIALAFKVKKNTHIIYTGEKGKGVCTIPTPAQLICIGQGNLMAASTTSLANGCTDQFVYIIDD